MISHKPLEARTTVKKRSVEIEDDSLSREEMAHYASLPLTRAKRGFAVDRITPSLNSIRAAEAFVQRFLYAVRNARSASKSPPHELQSDKSQHARDQRHRKVATKRKAKKSGVRCN